MYDLYVDTVKVLSNKSFIECVEKSNEYSTIRDGVVIRVMKVRDVKEKETK